MLPYGIGACAWLEQVGSLRSPSQAHAPQQTKHKQPQQTAKAAAKIRGHARGLSCTPYFFYAAALSFACFPKQRLLLCSRCFLFALKPFASSYAAFRLWTFYFPAGGILAYLRYISSRFYRHKNSRMRAARVLVLNKQNAYSVFGFAFRLWWVNEKPL